jgi:hypothetical protein
MGSSTDHLFWSFDEQSGSPPLSLPTLDDPNDANEVWKTTPFTIHSEARTKSNKDTDNFLVTVG